MSTPSSLNEVFRFTVRRPPIPPTAQVELNISIASSFREELLSSLTKGKDISRVELANASQNYLKVYDSSTVIDKLEESTLYKKFAKELLKTDSVDQLFSTIIERIFDQNFRDSSHFLQNETIVLDSLLAYRYAGNQPADAELVDVLGKALTAVISNQIGLTVAELLSVTLLFGKKDADGIEVLAGSGKPPSPPKDNSIKEIEDSIKHLKKLDLPHNYKKPTVPVLNQKLSSIPLIRSKNFFSYLKPFSKTSALARGEVAGGTPALLQFTPYLLSSEKTKEIPLTIQNTIKLETGLDVANYSLPDVINSLEEAWRNKVFFVPPFIFFSYPDIPITKGKVEPAGVADLMVVRQQIVRYQGGEVAHIENILRGEEKSRVHRKLDSMERFESETVEVDSKTENELETTERFEMQSEASRTIKEDQSAKAALSVSGSYGPSISFTASAEGSISATKQESTKSSTRYAKDVVDRSLSSIVEKKKTIKSLKILREIEETNSHKLTAPGDGEHISGVYQWVDKVYEAQIFNYGKRQLFELVIPEPASMLWYSMRSPKSGEQLPPPIPQFDVQPDEINEINYAQYASLYGASDITPPPKSYESVSKSFSAPKSADHDDPVINHNDDIAIPTGFEAQSFTARGAASTFTRHEHRSFTIVVGNVMDRISNPVGIIDLIERSFLPVLTDMGGDRDLTNKVPVAFSAVGYDSYALTIVIKCKRTSYAMQRWAHETYQKIRQAYEIRVADWENKVAGIMQDVSEGIEIKGRNPKLNRELENDELKRQAIELLTEQRFELFDATRDEPMPHFDFHQARREGQYIQFFENAFEWEQMMFSLYSYFWGRKTKWIDKLLANNTDPQHLDFLKAGAARVVLPVRPGYERAVLHFLETGTTWNGRGEPPDVTSPNYLSIVQEFKESSGNFDTELLVGEPWDVIVPTSLVRLRSDDALPRWEKDVDGDWIEA
jgi:hypothetical protein